MAEAQYIGVAKRFTDEEKAAYNKYYDAMTGKGDSTSLPQPNQDQNNVQVSYEKPESIAPVLLFAGV